MIERDNARVNRADKKCKLVKLESDTMGGTTIRRLAKRKDVDASVQRFVIPAADVCRVSILAAQPNEVELVFACIEHVDCIPERICLTNSLYN